MKIAVCIKRVVDMETRFKIAADGASVDEAGLKFDISDFDGYAVEAALQLVEKRGGETVAISVGPNVVQEAIRKALSMGVDRGIHLKADKVPADGLAIARALAAELRGAGYDLILFGRMPVSSAGHSVFGPAALAVRSRMSQRFFVRRLDDGSAMLNLGCGVKMHPRWVNLDFSTYARLASHPRLSRAARRIGLLSATRYERLQQVDPNIIWWDLRRGIPFPDGTFDVVYHSHMNSLSALCE